MLHEHLVHTVGREMPIEELHRAHSALGEAVDQYAEFHERAPIGCITLDREGLIGEINLAGAGLLGMNRSELVHRRVSMFVAPQQD